MPILRSNCGGKCGGNNEEDLDLPDCCRKKEQKSEDKEEGRQKKRKCGGSPSKVSEKKPFLEGDLSSDFDDGDDVNSPKNSSEQSPNSTPQSSTNTESPPHSPPPPIPESPPQSLPPPIPESPPQSPPPPIPECPPQSPPPPIPECPPQSPPPQSSDSPPQSPHDSNPSDSPDSFPNKMQSKRKVCRGPRWEPSLMVLKCLLDPTPVSEPPYCSGLMIYGTSGPDPLILLGKILTKLLGSCVGHVCKIPGFSQSPWSIIVYMSCNNDPPRLKKALECLVRINPKRSPLQFSSLTFDPPLSPPNNP